MFKLAEKNEIDRRILKGDFIRYSPSERSTINTSNSQININIPREDTVISLLNSYLGLHFDVLRAATGTRYADVNDKLLINLGVTALFSIHQLATSSGKHLEEINHANIVSLKYKLILSNEGSVDLSIGSDRDRGRQKNVLAESKNFKGKYHVRIYPKDIFGFAEHQQKGTYGLGYKLTITKNTDNDVLNKDNAVNKANSKIIALEQYVPHYTPSMDQEAILLKQIKDKIPTQLHYPERSVFMKEVNTQNFWTFELGTQECINVPIWIIVGLQQSDRQHDQTLNDDKFYRMPVRSAQVVIGTEKYPDNSVLLNFYDDDYSQGYGQIKEVFTALTEDNIL